MMSRIHRESARARFPLAGRFAWTLFSLSCLAPSAHAQFVSMELGKGTNLISVPLGVASTSGYTAASLMRDTGATFVMRPGVPVGRPLELAFPGEPRTDFPLKAGEALFVGSSVRRRGLLSLGSEPPRSLPAADLTVRGALDAIGLPLLPGATTTVSEAGLAAALGARTVASSVIDRTTGRTRFRTFIAGSAMSPMPLRAGMAYLVSVPPGTRTTTLTFYTDADSNGIPDDLDAQLSAGVDFDLDGLSNFVEIHLGSDPLLGDTDGDGVDDGTEVSALTDPTDPMQRPVTPEVGSLTPSIVKSDRSTVVTITGAGFTGTTRVKLSDAAGTNLTGVMVRDDGTLVATVPASSVGDACETPAGILPGTYDVLVTTARGTSVPGEVRLRVEAPSFDDDVHPIFPARCIPCHRPPSGIGGRFWASADPEESFAEITRSPSMLDLSQPAASRLLLKPLSARCGGIVMFGGVEIFADKTDAAYVTILRWIEAGGRRN